LYGKLCHFTEQVNCLWPWPNYC